MQATVGICSVDLFGIEHRFFYCRMVAVGRSEGSIGRGWSIRRYCIPSAVRSLTARTRGGGGSVVPGREGESGGVG